MGVGTDSGEYFDDEHHYQSAQWDPALYNENERSQVTITPVPETSTTVPPRAPEKPADAFESMDLSNAPFGVTAPSELPSGTLQGQVGAKKINDTIGSVVKAGTLAHDVMNGLDPTSKQGIERVQDLSQLMVFGPAGLGDKLAVDGTLGSFAGVKSKTLDKTKLYAAQEAEMNGAHPDDIWQDHGMFRGADQRWRYEIPDAGAKLLDKHFDKTLETYPNKETELTYSLKDSGKNFFGQNKGDIRLSDVLDHPELYKAYPHLQNIKIGSLPEGSRSHGQFDLTNNELRLGRNLAPEFIRSVLLHETQHAIQKHEGFALGGNPQKFLPQSFHELEAEYNKIPDKTGPGAEKARGALNEAYRQAMEQYNRLMGEVEARAVQKRMNFGPLERKYNTPHSSEDRPRFVQSNAGEGAAHSVVPMRSAANDNPTPKQQEEDRLLRKAIRRDESDKTMAELNRILKDIEDKQSKRPRIQELSNQKAAMRDILVKRDWSEIELAKYNKLDKEHHELLGLPFTPQE